MSMSAIHIVLVGTTHPGNIGATARAMKTMGLSSLYLVDSACEIDNRAIAMASGAQDILENAIVFKSLKDALKDCHLIFGLSARSRDIDLPVCAPEGCAQYIHKHLRANDHSQAAIIFGREHSGLTNEELLYCNYHVMIPTSSTYQSLNLSQAVQVIAYELQKSSRNNYQKEPRSKKNELAAHDDLERLYQHFYDVLHKIGFVKPCHSKTLMQRLRRLFNRCHLEKKEVAILRGILTHRLNYHEGNENDEL